MLVRGSGDDTGLIAGRDSERGRGSDRKQKEHGEPSPDSRLPTSSPNLPPCPKPLHCHHFGRSAYRLIWCTIGAIGPPSLP